MYRKMYYTLFSAVCDAMDLIGERRYQEAFDLLEEASIQTEHFYIYYDEDERYYEEDEDEDEDDDEEN